MEPFLAVKYIGAFFCGLLLIMLNVYTIYSVYVVFLTEPPESMHIPAKKVHHVRVFIGGMMLVVTSIDLATFLLI